MKMFDIRKKIADEVCMDSKYVRNELLLLEEACDLGVRISGLDDLSVPAIRCIFILVAYGPMNRSNLERRTKADASRLEDFLDVLSEYNFIEEHNGEYSALQKSFQCFNRLGRNFIIRRRLEMKTNYDYFDAIYKKLEDLENL